MADLSLSAAQIAAALDVSERSVWRWLADAPRAPRAGLRRGSRTRYRFPVAQVIAAVRAHRTRGVSTDEARSLVVAGCVSAAVGDANLRVGDPAPLLAALTPEESERARAVATMARRGLVVGAWGKVTSELEAAAWRVVLHPAALLAIFGDPQHLPAPENWPAFIHCFALANSEPRPTLHFTGVHQ